ncbi:MAG: T9SS type A sorting domain-containing protein [Bacteroidetes bacterium]|nr:T9SS type A sorting domain-containing protein [Bacteroidota bacterium]
MKTFYSTVITLLLFSKATFGQTTAQDWTKTDCTSINHTLYNYLNNEEVVIMEFAMGCGSCTDAATYLLNSKDKYAVSHPGKVHVFYMDYWPGNDCAIDVLPTTSPYAFDATFDHCSLEKDYYFLGSSPMPGIAIAAGSFHQIIYQSNNFAIDDTLLIEQAITDFFATASVNDSDNSNSLVISPNPSNGEMILSINNTENQKTKVLLFNIQGQLIAELLNEDLQTGETQKKIDLSYLPKGIYYLSKINYKESVNKKFIITN